MSYGPDSCPTLDRAGQQLRFLVGLDQQSTILDLAGYLAVAAKDGRGIARVVHVVEHAVPSGPLLERMDEARLLVEEAVFTLQIAGIGAEGVVSHARVDQVAGVLIDQAAAFQADAIVLRAQRDRGWRRIFGHGIREQVLRRSSVATVLVSGPPRRVRQRLERHSSSRG